VETKSSPAPSSVEMQAWRLLVLHGPDEATVGSSAVLASDRSLAIGRGESTQGVLGLGDPEVSEQHARVSLDREAGWTLHDLGSRNGTFVGGQRVTSRQLQDGDVLRIGRHLLLWQYLDGAACQRLVRSRLPPPSALVGRSHEALRVREEIQAAAAMPSPALILGESGVGKELAAQAIHEAAGAGPFVPVNCAALPESLAESELFGHARGAFTGASAESTGLFGLAEGGTLFLDEIAEMPLALQAKLLRALATGEVRGVGQRQARRIELRIVAATNVELDAAVRDGRFRGDLYARFVGCHVRLSPLRRRREDLLELALHFLGGAAVPLTTDAADALLIHDWPWNVRELEHVMAAVAVQARTRGRLTLDMLLAEVRKPLEGRQRTLPPKPGWDALLGIRRDSMPNRDELRRVLDHFQGNVSRVAAFLGRERRQVYRLAEQHSLDIVDSRAPSTGAGSPETTSPQTVTHEVAIDAVVSGPRTR